MAFISSGTTIIDNGAFQASLGSLVHIKTLTASSSATLSFVHGTDGVVLDSTYPIYKFEFINIHPANNDDFMVNFTTDGTNFNVTKTTTYFHDYHEEGDVEAGLTYNTARDVAQGTGDAFLTHVVGNDNDQSCAGTFTLFNPSSTTFVKHFISTVHLSEASNYANTSYVAGYCNTTSAITGVRFLIQTGNIDSGKIKLYGIKDS
jgi:hypothetical protein